MLLSFAAEWKLFQGHSNEAGEIAGRIGRTMFMISYLAMLFGFVAPLRLLEQNNSLGLISIICLIATVKMADATAYFAGKSFGTIKLAPKISPGKTLQGTLAAPLGGYFAAAIVIYIVSPLVFGITIDRPWWWVILYGVLVTCAGVLGRFGGVAAQTRCRLQGLRQYAAGLGRHFGCARFADLRRTRFLPSLGGSLVGQRHT